MTTMPFAGKIRRTFADVHINVHIDIHVIKPVLFIAILIIIFIYISSVFVISGINNAGESANILAFYYLPDNSVDLVAIAGSTIWRGVSPDLLYTEYGISATNISCSSQPVFCSYYLLKNFIMKQSPKVIIMDPWALTHKPAEANYRKVIDTLPNNRLKLEAIWEHSKQETAEPLLSYLFPLAKYNKVWKSLPERTFNTFVGGDDLFSGFLMSHNVTKELKISMGEGTDLAKYDEEELIAFDKIVDLCDQNGIRLILISQLNTKITIKDHNAYQAFADSRGITYIDFNTPEMLEQLNINMDEDIYDATHVNIYGAEKVTHYLGQFITDTSPLPDRRLEERYEYLNTSANEYTHWKYVQLLRKITDLAQYLETITSGENSAAYTAMLSIRDEGTQKLGDAVKAMLIACGFKVDLTDQNQISYIAILESGQVIHEQLGKDKKEALSYAGTTADGTVYFVESAGYGAGNRSVTTIAGGSNQSKNQRGINILVYDNETHRVVDSVNWDTYANEGGGAAKR